MTARIATSNKETAMSETLPELRRRRLFRTEYVCSTLRENLGLARPAHRVYRQDERWASKVAGRAPMQCRRGGFGYDVALDPNKNLN